MFPPAIARQSPQTRHRDFQLEADTAHEAVEWVEIIEPRIKVTVFYASQVQGLRWYYYVVANGVYVWLFFWGGGGGGCGDLAGTP